MEGDIHEEASFAGGCSARPVCPAATAIAGGRAEREAMGSGQTAGNGGTQSQGPNVLPAQIRIEAGQGVPPDGLHFCVSRYHTVRHRRGNGCPATDYN